MILEALPEWFGIPESTAAYVADLEQQQVLVAQSGGADIGFLALKKHNPINTEVAVIGILPDYHRKGAGRLLIEAACKAVKKDGGRFLTVKTISADSPNLYYARTREFYLGVGFEPFEVFPELWHPNNPCLLLVNSV